jgi:microcystin-dependent protein
MKRILATATLVCALHTAGGGPASAQQEGFQYLSEIRLFASWYCPNGWLPAAGQVLPINENNALFSLVGTAYGGDGQRTFALPDLRKVPPSVGDSNHGATWCIAVVGAFPQRPAEPNHK